MEIKHTRTHTHTHTHTHTRTQDRSSLINHREIMMSSETSPSFSEGTQPLARSATKLEHRVNLIPTLMRTQLTSGLQASLSLLLLLPCCTLSLSSQSAGRCVRRVTARTRSFPSTCKEPSRTRSVKVTVKVNRAPASSNNTLGIHQFVCSSVNFLPTPAPNHPPPFLSFLLESVTPPPPPPPQHLSFH